MKNCPECGVKLSKIIYAGFPGKVCETCFLMLGLASWAAFIAFNGKIFVYEGSFWRALWHWLFDKE